MTLSRLKLTSLLVFVVSAAFGAATNVVTLAWNPSQTVEVPIVYSLHASTNAAEPLPWNVVTNVPSTSTNVSVMTDRVPTYFYVTAVNATNSQFESDPSNVALAPWPMNPKNLNLKKGQ